ncbi:probable disease resistance protein At4g27220 isoform X3 [Syzygium oleosum]|uniref:probable disease resistance protein At4g27220 isoform X3 n=1 Tax=Syzygium oleosum TaxID=219896 RepID=UPI0024B937E6|nr:probable disease resistance protein At4g27220 isoform X3 [Syzygium oleosum]
MPREKDSFRDHVKFLPNNKWKCNFCSKEYGGSVTRIKAHLAGVAGYGINDCKDVDGRVRSEARNALKCKGAAEPSSGAEGNVEEGPHLPVTANNEDAWREPSYAAMPYLSSDVMSTVGASSSAFLPLPETNLPSQSLPAQGMIPWGEFPLLPQQPQSHAGDSYTQPRNFSCPISRPDLAPEPLTNMPAPVNAEEGETNTEVPQGASSSAFLPLLETNLPSQSLPAQNMIPWGEFPFSPQQPQSQAGDSSIQPWNFSYPSSRPDLAPEALTNMPRPVNAEEGEPNTEVPQDARIDDALVDSRPGSFGLVGEYMPTLKRKLEELSSRVADLDELETRSRKSKRINDWGVVRAFREGKSVFVQQVERVDDLIKEVEEILGHYSFQKGLTTHAGRCRKSSPLVTTKLVGKKSEQTIEEICDYLMEDEIFIIGVYGMGGVGKTAILMHVHNRILENSAFNDVFWVTVPQEFSFCELQDEIANAVGLDNLSKDKDVKRRASMLNRHLKKKRAVLILDGLWMHFDFEDVGIPVEKGGIKLVLTTRSLNVCHEMLCQKEIKIKPLEKLNEDDWSLFREKLCFGRELPSEVKKIAKSIVDKCGGLPLGIIEIATHMRRVEEVHEWKGMLWKLEESRVELNVFKRLKLSYVNLGDSQVQQCFLHLAQVYQKSSKTKLIESFIDEGLLDRISTRQEVYEQGNIILDKLRKGCLCDEDGQHISLHPLIRGMALHIMRSTTHVVKAKMGLKEIPEEEFWTDRLEKVFLQGNNIQKIPYSISPNCPKLMSLSLNNNMFLEAIHESFFRHMKGLKVLDLSYTSLTKLPNAISHLRSLEALLLRECEELYHIPCIQNLGSLRKLDLNGCTILKEVPDGMEMLVKLSYLDLHGTMIETLPEGLKHMKGLKVLDLSCTSLTELPNAISHLESLEALLLRECEELCHIPCVRNLGSLRKLDLNGCVMLEEVPEGMEMLVKLRYLDLWGTGIETLPKGVLGKLVNLQYLVIKKGTGWVVGKLEKVEGLYCSVPNVETFNACVRILEQNSSLPYELLLNESGYHSFKDKHERHIIIESCHSIAARVDGEIGGDDHALLPKNVQVLKVRWCDGMTSLCEVSPLDNLEKLKIEEWEKLEELGAVHFPHLRRLKITRCPKLKHLLEEGQGFPRLQWFRIEGSEELEEINMEAPLLYSIEVCKCPKMKRVVEWERLATHLPNLRSIEIQNCEKLEEIIGGGPATPIGATCLLAEFELYGCNNIKGVLLTHDMLLRLPYLQDIIVGDCKGIEVILGTVPDMTHPFLPNLIRLTLRNLPELKSTCDGIVSWVSFQRIDIKNCPKLKRLPLLDNGFSCPPLYLRSILINRLTWESLEYPPPSLRSILTDRLTWSSPEQGYFFFRSSLEHFVRFHGKSSPPNFYFSFILSISRGPF